MLDATELTDTAAAFGVAEDQVKRDHLLTALAGLARPIVFFGGTALARTWLPDPAAGQPPSALTRVRRVPVAAKS